MLVHERQHDVILFDHIEERISKPPEDCPPDFAFDLLVQLRVRPQMRLGSFEAFYER